MKKLYILCASAPSADPRIGWVAQLASRYFKVEVWGVSRGVEAQPVKREHYTEHVLNIPVLENTQYEPQKGHGYGFWDWLGVYWKIMLVQLGWMLAHMPVAAIKKIAGLLGRRRNAGVVVNDNPTFNYYWMVMNFKRMYLHLLGLVRMWREKPDVVLCADLDALKAGVWAKKHYGVPLLYDAHEFFAYSVAGSSKAQQRYFLRYERRLLRRVDAAFAVNPLLGAEMERQLGYSPMLPVPNCEPFAEHERLDCGNLQRLAAGRVSFLSLGSFAPMRGLEELVDGWRGVDEQAVLFLQGPQNTVRDALEKRAKAHGLLGTRIFILPPVGVEALVSAAACADVGIIPYPPNMLNNTLCCPNKLSQYMQAGVALLANHTRYVADRVHHYACGAVYNGDAASLAHAVDALVNDRNALETMKVNAYAAARDDFNWEKQSRLMAEVFEGLS